MILQDYKIDGDSITITKQELEEFRNQGTNFRCAVARDIFTQYMGYGNETISSRSWEATQGNRCPYIKTEWPKRKKRDKDKSLKLF